MRVALCVIATGKYINFLEQFVESARRLFLCACDLSIFVFADAELVEEDLVWYPARHRPWPLVTLYRYKTMLQARKPLLECDYVFYCDVDCYFDGRVRDEVFGGLVAVEHPGFAGRPRASFTYEKNPLSTACVLPHEGTRYYAGGFQGGESRRYVAAMERMAKSIEIDAERGLMAVWHDESHWNRYLIDHQPDVVLSPLYCSPDTWNVEGRKIVAITKDHAEVRS
jgi:histo-blood group ABO system transferase